MHLIRKITNTVWLLFSQTMFEKNEMLDAEILVGFNYKLATNFHAFVADILFFFY